MTVDKKILYKNLLQYGFSENEAAIYMTLSENVELSVYEIAQKTSIPRTTVYATLEKMQKKGFVLKNKKNGVLNYYNESYQELLRELQSKKEITLQSLIPGLQSLSGIEKYKPEVQIFTGKDGIQKVFERILETLTHNKEKRLYAISDKEILTLLPEYFPQWIKKREESRIFSQLITSLDVSPETFPKNEFRETRFLDEINMLSGAVEIYKDTVIFVSLKEQSLYAIEIKSKDIYQIMKSMFMAHWQKAYKPK